ncbi:MAG: 3'(2'),5'-bisphosphate nucleotidase CysQ, partial [Alphaproteobacteria bacterium]
MSNETYMTLAKRLVQPVRDAGKEIMQIHAAGVVADTKADGSPVTMADEAAEAILLHALREMAPDIALISEENAESHR